MDNIQQYWDLSILQIFVNINYSFNWISILHWINPYPANVENRVSS
jgi:hypothetical protein